MASVFQRRPNYYSMVKVENRYTITCGKTGSKTPSELNFKDFFQEPSSAWT